MATMIEWLFFTDPVYLVDHGPELGTGARALRIEEEIRQRTITKVANQIRAEVKRQQGETEDGEPTGKKTKPDEDAIYFSLANAEKLRISTVRDAQRAKTRERLIASLKSRGLPTDPEPSWSREWRRGFKPVALIDKYGHDAKNNIYECAPCYVDGGWNIPYKTASTHKDDLHMRSKFTMLRMCQHEFEGCKRLRRFQVPVAVAERLHVFEVDLSATTPRTYIRPLYHHIVMDLDLSAILGVIMRPMEEKDHIQVCFLLDTGKDRYGLSLTFLYWEIPYLQSFLSRMAGIPKKVMLNDLYIREKGEWIVEGFANAFLDCSEYIHGEMLHWKFLSEAFKHCTIGAILVGFPWCMRLIEDEGFKYEKLLGLLERMMSGLPGAQKQTLGLGGGPEYHERVRKLLWKIDDSFAILHKAFLFDRQCAAMDTQTQVMMHQQSENWNLELHILMGVPKGSIYKNDNFPRLYNITIPLGLTLEEYIMRLTRDSVQRSEVMLDMDKKIEEERKRYQP